MPNRASAGAEVANVPHRLGTLKQGAAEWGAVLSVRVMWHLPLRRLTLALSLRQRNGHSRVWFALRKSSEFQLWAFLFSGSCTSERGKPCAIDAVDHNSTKHPLRCFFCVWGFVHPQSAVGTDRHGCFSPSCRGGRGVSWYWMLRLKPGRFLSVAILPSCTILLPLWFLEKYLMPF